jgi:hypothetical protein
MKMTSDLDLDRLRDDIQCDFKNNINLTETIMHESSLSQPTKVSPQRLYALDSFLYERGILQRDLALLARISHVTLSQIICGHRSSPSARTRQKILKALRLLGWQGDENNILPLPNLHKTKSIIAPNNTNRNPT